MTAPVELPSTVLVVSPHLDDAVLGAGELLAGSQSAVVLTVFAGSTTDTPLTPWDERAGFRDGDDVVARRRAEDAAALRVLDATPRWLPFLDGQYGCTPAVEEIADAIAAVVDEVRPEATVMPLGLFHDDHLRASAACEQLIAQRPGMGWMAYEDALYRAVDAAAAPRRLAALARFGRWRPVEVHAPATASAKRVAVSCYRSQLRALAESYEPSVVASIEGPEMLWSLDAHR